MHFSIDRTVHTTAFDKPVVDHWLERKIFRKTYLKSEASPTKKEDIRQYNILYCLVLLNRERDVAQR